MSRRSHVPPVCRRILRESGGTWTACGPGPFALDAARSGVGARAWTRLARGEHVQLEGGCYVLAGQRRLDLDASAP